MQSIRAELTDIFTHAIRHQYPHSRMHHHSIPPALQAAKLEVCPNSKFGDFQCISAMGLANVFRSIPASEPSSSSSSVSSLPLPLPKNPHGVGEELIASLRHLHLLHPSAAPCTGDTPTFTPPPLPPASPCPPCMSPFPIDMDGGGSDGGGVQVAGPGVVSFSLHPSYTAHRINSMMGWTPVQQASDAQHPQPFVPPLSSFSPFISPLSSSLTGLAAHNYNLDAVLGSSCASAGDRDRDRDRGKRVIVDFSSPNIAKEMHVGHLRSTIIGDCLSNLLEYSGHAVHRVNHVGDWGTQFGMLIAHIRDAQPSLLLPQSMRTPQRPDSSSSSSSSSPSPSAPPLTLADLQSYYRQAKERFDTDMEFRQRSLKEVVRLQAGDEANTRAWRLFCSISRQGFQDIYRLLKIDNLEERGESFYNPLLAGVVQELREAGLATEEEGALMIMMDDQREDEDKNKNKDVDDIGRINTGEEGQKGEKTKKEKKKKKKKKKKQKIKSSLPNFPLILVKSDGGYTYDTTDLAAVKHRVQQEKADWLIYVTDAGQEDHFKLVFEAATRAKWLDSNSSLSTSSSTSAAADAAIRLDHVGFGVVVGKDGKKYKTRSGEVVKLRDLLDEAEALCTHTLLQRREKAGAGVRHSDDPVEGGVDDGVDMNGSTADADADLQETARAIAYSCIKYADLSNHRKSDYQFDFDSMMDMRGDTAMYLMYTYARLASIIGSAHALQTPSPSTSPLSATEAMRAYVPSSPLFLSREHNHPSELQLATVLSQFYDAVERVEATLEPHHLCAYMYRLSCAFADFYRDCRVIDRQAEEVVMKSPIEGEIRVKTGQKQYVHEHRLALCVAAARVLKQSCQLLGLDTVDKI